MPTDRVLVVAPHIDDEVLGVGGTIAKHVETGDDVSVIFIADRDPPRKEIQRHQAAAARLSLGYHQSFFLGMRDMELDVRSRKIIEHLEYYYEQIKPTVVYTCWSGDYHTDHRAVHEAVNVVCRPLGPLAPRELYSYEISQYVASQLPGSEPFVPNIFNVLSPTQVEKKLDAFRKYTDEIEDFPHPRSDDNILNFLTHRGMCAGADAAEAFMLLRKVTL